MDARNKKVLITGATSGIGRSLTLRFIQEGCTVIAVGRDTSKISDLAQEKLITYSTDLAERQSVIQLADWIKTNHPDLDILINNAGIQYNYSFINGDSHSKEIEHEFAVNLLAPIHLCDLLLPVLLETKSPKAIVNVSSGLADVPKATAPVYCASKAALKQFSKALKWQLEKTHIAVFDLSPPLVDTEMTAGRGTGKISPEQLVDEFWPKFQRGQYHIDTGKVKWLKRINRISPLLAESIMKKG